MRPRASRRRLVWLERALLVVAIACLGYYGYLSVEARQFQREQKAAFESRLESHSVASAVAPDRARADNPVAPVAPVALAPGTMGLLEIPRLNVSSPVVSGDSDDVLDVAVGHLPDTPAPWEPGNSAFAAHRDGLFRPLKSIRVGDELRVRTVHGDFLYLVRTTKIVMPNDLSVLAAGATDLLTLITCYPFNYVGNAPKRFIVQAERAEAPAPSAGVDLSIPRQQQ